jgi:hypothetical protein
MGRRVDIPRDKLDAAKEKIEAGETTYEAAAKELDVGFMALRGNFERAGMEVKVPTQKGRGPSGLLSKTGDGCPWNGDMANDWAMRALVVNA